MIQGFFSTGWEEMVVAMVAQITYVNHDWFTLERINKGVDEQPGACAHNRRWD